MVLQGGVGQGTVARKRRNPRERVEDVAITEASGLAIGPDGYPHPLEVTARGKLRVTDEEMVTLLTDILACLQRIEMGLILQGAMVNVA